jgi:hypothetical protein
LQSDQLFASGSAQPSANCGSVRVKATLQIHVQIRTLHGRNFATSRNVFPFFLKKNSSSFTLDYDRIIRSSIEKVTVTSAFAPFHAQFGPSRVTMARFYGVRVVNTGSFECTYPFYLENITLNGRVRNNLTDYVAPR